MADLADTYLAVRDRVAGFIDGGSAAMFGELALEVFDFQRRSNEAYGKFCEGLHIDGWRSIPAVPTAAFKDLDRPLYCFPKESAERYFETSGTTGESRGRHYFHDFELYRRAIDAGWAGVGVPKGLPRHWLPGLEGRSSLKFMLEHLSGRQASDATAFGEPVVLMGTALAFLHLFENGCGRLPEGSWAMETGGYKGSGREISKPDLYAMFEDHLGVPPERVINEYGMTELSSQFYAIGVDGEHEAPRWARVVVRSPETGEEVEVGEAGYVTVYDLANLGSVMAVATQDLAVRREGGKFQLIGRDPAAIPRGCSRAADEFLSKS